MSAPVNSIKRTVQVTIVKEIEVELMPSMFIGMSESEFLAEFSKGLWAVDSIDDVLKYAARSAAYGPLGSNHEGIGVVDHHFVTCPRVPDVKIREISDDCEEEILSAERTS